MAIESLIEFFSGNDVELFFTVVDADNPPNPKNLTGATEIIFAIAPSEGATAVLTKSKTANPTQVVITDGPNGKFNVVLPKPDTEPLGPLHKYHEARVTDSAGKTATVSFGEALIRKNTIAS